jgi:prefoldin alpha subunit
MSDDNAPQTINLDTLSLEQLNGMKQSEENRLNALTARYAQLRAAAARLHASQNAIGEISDGSSGSSASKEVMVPLTESVYVPGTLMEKEKLLVEIGTGFYVEKTPKDTNAFLERKLKIVDMNSENITKVVQATRSNLESIQIAMQGKLLEIRARQEGQRHRTAVEGSGNEAAETN